MKLIRVKKKDYSKEGNFTLDKWKELDSNLQKAMVKFYEVMDSSGFKLKANFDDQDKEALKIKLGNTLSHLKRFTDTLEKAKGSL